MKILFDQNLSSKLVDRLKDLYPGSKHLSEVGLESATDFQVGISPKCTVSPLQAKIQTLVKSAWFVVFPQE